MEIKTRVRSHSDSLLLMGYSGSPHPLLASAELERELDWCRRSPWGSGAKALLGQEPRHLLPVCPDLLRESVEGVYGRHGFESVGVAVRFTARGGDAFRFPAARAGQAVLYPAWVLPADGGTRPIGRLEAPVILAAAATAGRQPLFLLLEPEAKPGPLLAPLLQALAARFEPRFLTLEEALAERRLRTATAGRGRSRGRRPLPGGPPSPALPLRPGGLLPGRSAAHPRPPQDRRRRARRAGGPGRFGVPPADRGASAGGPPQAGPDPGRGHERPGLPAGGQPDRRLHGRPPLGAAPGQRPAAGGPAR